MSIISRLFTPSLDTQETAISRYHNHNNRFRDCRTPESLDSLLLFVRDVNKYRLLQKDEEYELSRRQIKGDSRARYILIVTNLRLVVKIAHDFKGKGLPLKDLVAEGMLGLMKGVSKYNPDYVREGQRAKLSTYVAHWIKQTMRRAIANQANIIRIPIQSANIVNKIKKLEDRYEGLGELTNKVIAAKLECSQRTIKNLRNAPTDVLSLDEAVTDCDIDFNSLIASDNLTDNILEKEKQEILYKAIQQLNPKEQFIVIERFGLISGTKKTLTELEEPVGRTRERIRQMEKQALSKLYTILSEQFHYNGES